MLNNRKVVNGQVRQLIEKGRQSDLYVIRSTDESYAYVQLLTGEGKGTNMKWHLHFVKLDILVM